MNESNAVSKLAESEMGKGCAHCRIVKISSVDELIRLSLTTVILLSDFVAKHIIATSSRYDDTSIHFPG